MKSNIEKHTEDVYTVVEEDLVVIITAKKLSIEVIVEQRESTGYITTNTLKFPYPSDLKKVAAILDHVGDALS